MAVIDMLRPTAGTWRVVVSRWLLYMLATLPGMMSMSRHLNDTIGVRPWFQDLQTPLDMVSTKFLLAELGDGVALLAAGVFVVWLLQLVWLAGSIRVLDPNRPEIHKKVFSNGWSFLGRFVRIAVFAAIALFAMQWSISKGFGVLSARAETEAWSVYDGYVTLTQWRISALFVAFTLVGLIAFWVRIYAVTQDRRDLRRLPWQVMKLIVRRPLSAMLWQFALVCAVLFTHAIALVCWRQSSNDGLWFGLWVLLLLLTAFIWQLRIRLAIGSLATFDRQ